MPKRSSKDMNQLAASILDAVTKAAEENPAKNPAAVALGRRGGLVGGKARAESMTANRRVQIAKRAAAARWGAKRKR